MNRAILTAVAAAALLASPAQALETDELLALVAMPLAVNAVAEITDVPQRDLFDLVALLNDADVSPPQFIEVVRYVPVALVVETDDTPFVDFVRLQLDQGVRRDRLVRVIETRFQTIGLEDVDLVVTAPRVTLVDENFIPPIVRTRVAESRTHPHGGPPGQIKREIGVQTGAEVVHGTHPGKGRDPKQRPARDVVGSVTDDPPRENQGRGRAVAGAREEDKSNRGKGSAAKAKPDKGKGQSKGKGKGKGND